MTYYLFTAPKANMRRSIQFLTFTVFTLLLFLLMPLHARHAQLQQAEIPTELRNLHLTDLCLSTEARYTRHLAMADHHAAFQEHPLGLEHFPSGSIILPIRDNR